MLTGLAAVAAIALLSTYLIRRQAAAEAVRTAAEVTTAEGRAVVEPLLDDGLLSGSRETIERLDDTVRRHILGDQVVRVKVWAADGRILYSDEPRLMGSRFDLGEDERAIIDSGGTFADVSDLEEAENRFERGTGKLLEVYLGVRTLSGTPLLYESYLRFSSVQASSRHTWGRIAPAMVGGLVLLYLIQLPLARSLARHVHESQLRDHELSRRAAQASETERRRIAADLHDGVVQGLSGASYSLSVAADTARAEGVEDVAVACGRAAADLRQWVRELRTLMVTVAPPELHREGLETALRDLVSPLARDGVETGVHVEHALQIDSASQSLVFRTAQEAVRNATNHSGASHIQIRLERPSAATVRLEVTDDGAGFDPTAAEAARHDGHLGLHLLSQLATEAGGHLVVGAREGSGTAVVLEIPQP